MPTEEKPLGIGIIGFGFIGRTHFRAYEAAARAGFACRLHAICDSSAAHLTPARGGGNLGETDAPLDISGVKLYDSVKDLLADEEVEAVSICTPTDTHVPIAQTALAANCHTLIEKPLALSAEAARPLLDQLTDNGPRCLPAMCMRFWPGWSWLREQIRRDGYGPLKRLRIQRVGPMPTWSPKFYQDNSRCGDALLDLHVHDTDFLYWIFGRPTTVSATGSTRHITTRYTFDHAAEITAEGGWLDDPAADFRMQYIAEFESATARFDLSADNPLIIARAAEETPVELPSMTGWDGQIRHFIGLIANGGGPALATIPEAVEVLEIIAAERASLESGKPVELAARG